jgi:carboxylate-amine ligase
LLPTWAQWSPAGADRPWTVGVEEEVLLLDPCDGSIANRAEDVLAALPPGVRASAETHACVVELVTRPHDTVAEVRSELHELRLALADTLDALGLRGAVAGTHPSAVWSEVEVSPRPRYDRVHASMRELARREPTCALHVHVAVPDGEAAVRALAGLRPELPLLLALSANSPYWQGRHSGLASTRTAIMSMFPRVGIPRRFGSYGQYAEAVDTLVRAEAIPDPSFIWWDVRLQPRLGTVEVRIMDAQTRPSDTGALAALVQCLVRLHAETDAAGAEVPPEVLDENRFLAARDGIDARLVTASGRRARAAGEPLEDAIARCAAVAGMLSCTEELEADVRRLAAEPGHLRQRAVAGPYGLDALQAHLAEQLAAPHDRRAAAA